MNGSVQLEIKYGSPKWLPRASVRKSGFPYAVLDILRRNDGAFLSLKEIAKIGDLAEKDAKQALIYLRKHKTPSCLFLTSNYDYFTLYNFSQWGKCLAQGRVEEADRIFKWIRSLVRNVSYTDLCGEAVCSVTTKNFPGSVPNRSEVEDRLKHCIGNAPQIAHIKNMGLWFTVWEGGEVIPLKPYLQAQENEEDCVDSEDCEEDGWIYE